MGPPCGCSCSLQGRYSAGMNETVTTMIKTTPIVPHRADEMIAVKKPNVSLFLNLDVPMLFKHIKYLQTKEICLAIRSVPLSLSVRMSVSDFRQNFEVMEVCHLTEALGEPGSSMLPLSCIMHHGNWAPNITAGGSPQGGKTGDDVCQMFCASLLTLNLTSPAAGFKTGDKAGIFKTRQKFTSTITTEFKSRGQSGKQLVSCVN